MNAPLYRWDGEALLLTIYVQPRAKHDAILGPDQRGVRVRVQAPPVNGAANSRLITVFAREFGVAKKAVTLQRGTSGRGKQVRIQAPRRIPLPLQGLIAANTG